MSTHADGNSFPFLRLQLLRTVFFCPTIPPQPLLLHSTLHGSHSWCSSVRPGLNLCAEFLSLMTGPQDLSNPQEILTCCFRKTLKLEHLGNVSASLHSQSPATAAVWLVLPVLRYFPDWRQH